MGWVECGGAVVVAAVAVAVRGRPLEDPGCDHLVAPSGEGLKPVVAPAQGGEVVGLCPPGLWSALGFGVGIVGDDMVDVAASGRPGAPGEHAGAVSEDDLLTEPVGHLVRVGVELGVEVDDGLDGDLGPGVGAPRLHLLEQHQPLAFLKAAGGPEHGGVAREAGVEVGVEDDLACRRQALWVGTCSGEVERGLGAGEVTEGLRAAHVQRLGGSERGLGGGTLGQDPVEVDRVGHVDLGLDPHGAGEMHLLGVDGDVTGVDVEPAIFGISGRVGGGEVEPFDGLGDEPVELGGADLPATAATWASTNPAASRVSEGEEWMVVSATERAFQAGTRPAWTWAHNRGSRWRSSRAWPISFFAAVVEVPRTPPSSAMQNSATSGVPSPAMGSSCS
jgi:hypothetical protein